MAPVDSAPRGLAFDPLSLLQNSSPPMFALSLLLLVAAAAVWFVAVIKLRQLHRWRRAEAALHATLRSAPTTLQLEQRLAPHQNALGAALIQEVVSRNPDEALIEAETEHAMLRHQRAAFAWMTLLGSIATTAPLAGLFGTVYGIMEAFSKIGREKTAALPVVAPSIGDALITTALGLFAAIPAVIVYNLLSRRLEDHLEEVRTFARAWLKMTLYKQSQEP